MDWILQPWSWWFSGILIGLTVPALYFLAGKAFGISTSLQHIGAACTPNVTLSYLRDHNWRAGIWNLVLIVGIVIGAFIANQFLSSAPVEFLPASFHNTWGVVRLAVGGVMVGFGTRYAGGCTSGHTITGISNFNIPSVIASLFFFVGGLIVTWGFGWLFV
jgi:uncharacterized membrane protein YedE/YeeE